ncbi:PREDICTED: pEARLI1-like lipid transfer protein 2 [Nelumbo nucifera]|uniref:Bifunctional inhibitor/plant lipid transfer protein/seed storage helical domain-containing protein n=2 Tax=Nelumbo nucifera TaxID=4432 RepID=A0A822YQQ8_NELNU|nr:PREDICTED: pEARLI1-like lipid transfer protein 2 [Nelumbo nucifera]DAD36524.1 TPA_asm: hypothetical protein HUJ06_007165 [Nelumbo nucifera]
MTFMGSKESAFLTLLNLLFFISVSSHKLPCTPPTQPIPKTTPTVPYIPTYPTPQTPPTVPYVPTYPTPAETPPTVPYIPTYPTPGAGAPPLTPAPIHKKPGSCPRDMLKLGACTNLLGTPIIIGAPLKGPCCAVLGGLADLEVAMCLCTALKASIMGINIGMPQAFSMLVNACGKKVPDGFQCA